MPFMTGQKRGLICRVYLIPPFREEINWLKNLTTDWSLVYSKAKRQIPDNAQFSIASAVNPNTNTGTYTISPPVVEKSVEGMDS